MTRSPRLFALLTALVLVLGAASGGEAAPDADPLGRDLDRILADPRLAGTGVGLVVRDADTGELLYTRSGATRLLPASNAKLVTTATALEVLGPDHRMRTELLTDGASRGPDLTGDLYLRGTGDPTMMAKDYDDMAAKLAADGVRVVRGSLVADDTWFDSVRLGSGWAWDDEPYSYNAQTSALTVSPDADYDAGSVIVRVRPGAPGQPVQVDVTPPTDYVTIDNTAVTGGQGGISIDREHGTNTVRVRGSIAPDSGAVTEYIAVWNPTALVASLFRKALADHGITLLGGVEYRATPPGARLLTADDSMPLGELIVPLLKLSNNMHSEVLVKAAGRKVFDHGSWDAGLRALLATLPGLGVDPAGLSMVDGSGLSRMDYLSADQLVALLTAARGKPWFAGWYAALPIAGKADRLVGGTLRNRMRGTPAEGNVHAKTGSLSGVTALSGYVTTAAGRPLVFAFLQNNFVAGSTRDLEDAVAVRLASPPGTAIARTPVPPTGSELECSWTKAC